MDENDIVLDPRSIPTPKESIDDLYQALDTLVLPVSIENDGKCDAHAELWKGSLKDVNSGAVILIGFGIGGASTVQQENSLI